MLLYLEQCEDDCPEYFLSERMQEISFLLLSDNFNIYMKKRIKISFRHFKLIYYFSNCTFLKVTFSELALEKSEKSIKSVIKLRSDDW